MKKQIPDDKCWSVMSHYKTASIYMVASVLPAAFGFIMLPFYSRFLSTSEFAIVAAMGTVSLFASGFFNLALDRAAQRFYFDTEDDLLGRQVFGTFLIGSVCCSLLFFFVSILFAPLLQAAFPDIYFYPYFFLTLFTSAISSVFIMLQQYCRVSKKPVLYLLLVASILTLQYGLAFIFIYYLQWQALGQIFGLFIAAALLLPVALSLSFKYYIFQINWKLLLDGLKYSWPFIPTLMVAWILNWSDQIFIARYLNMNDLGYYSMAYKISSIFFLVVMAVSMTFSPYFFKQANLLDQKGVKSSLKVIINKLGYFITLAAFFLALFSYEIVTLLLDVKYNGTESLIRLILISHLISGIMSVSTNLYYLQSKRTKLQLVVVMATALLNLGLNFVLIPEFGLYGAIYATIFSMLFLAVMHYTFAKKCYFIPVSWLRFLGLIFTGILIVELALYLDESLIFKLFVLGMIIVFIWIKKEELLKVG